MTANQSAYRRTERTEHDPLGTDAVAECARAIMRAVADPAMHPSIPTKVARAVVERSISPDEVAKLCDIIAAKRNQLNSPGAYFLSSVRRMFRAADLQW